MPNVQDTLVVSPAMHTAMDTGETVIVVGAVAMFLVLLGTIFRQRTINQRRRSR